jgi:hypothetical protein
MINIPKFFYESAVHLMSNLGAYEERTNKYMGALQEKPHLIVPTINDKLSKGKLWSWRVFINVVAYDAIW